MKVYTNIFKPLLILIIFNTLYISANSQTFNYTINWEKNKIVSDSINLNVHHLLNFENASTKRSDFLPYFIKIIKMSSSNTNYSVKLENINFIAFSESEIKDIENTSKIKSNFEVISHLYYIRKIPYLQISILPIRNNNGTFEKLTNFSLKITPSSAKNRVKEKRYASNSVLQSGKWVKIKVDQTGVYKLTYDELKSIGIENPERVRVFGNSFGLLSLNNADDCPDDLMECDILRENSSIIFYASSPDKWKYNTSSQKFEPIKHLYSDYSYYFLSSDYDSGYNNSIKTINQSTANATHNVNTFDDYATHNEDLTNLAKSGRTFYGELFDINTNQNFNFTFNNIIPNSDVYIEVEVATASNTRSLMNVKVLNQTKSISFRALPSHTKAVKQNLSFNATAGSSNKINFNLIYNQPTPSSKAWLDYINIQVKRNLIFSGNLMNFRNTETVGAGNISNFTLSNANSNVTIWDVTNPTNPQKINAIYNGSSINFKLATSSLREFCAFNSSAIKTPIISDAVVVSNQNLHATSGNTEMIIVTHPKFYSQANEIKLLHERMDNMKISLVTPEQIYNEFSSGMPDIAAIRNFAKMVYDKSTSNDTLKYLLLFGNGSYVNKTDDTETYHNYILTYQSVNSISESESDVSDDFFGILDNGEGVNKNELNGLLDIGVGRIPVISKEQADEHISKIKSYVSSETFGSWRNNLCFIADDADDGQNAHIRDADTLAIYLNKYVPELNTQKVYLDAYEQITLSGGERYPEVNEAIANTVAKGNLVINWTGHGSPRGWAHERILSITEINNWKNSKKLPLFVTATCEFTRFDDWEFVSAGERIFLNPNGGAIAMFTTARLAYINSNGKLTKALYKTMFKYDYKGNPLRLGDIIRKTKNDLGANDTNSDIFFLLGDPALKLGYGENVVVSTKINNQDINTYSDTIKALSKVTIKGEVRYRNGNKISDFNGTVFPTVYDKKRLINSRDNEGYGVNQFTVQDNIVFKGQATAKNGEFEYSFIVPKDIALNIDTGKISYYAFHNNVTAKGYSNKFKIGGVSNNYDEDNEGPEIKLYMNDDNFVSGGITNKNPAIFAKLWDESGINTASGAFGHGITAIIDEKSKNEISLNDDYVSDKNTYQSGKLNRQLFNLENGNHSLKLKVWDVYNNSSEEYIDFLVLEAENVSISQLLNYPNPFTTHTDFYFEHNQAGTELDVMIQIFTISGKLVKTINETFFADGFRAGPFAWNGTDDFGNNIGRGVYVYRVKLRSQTGETIEKFEKLLILK